MKLCHAYMARDFVSLSAGASVLEAAQTMRDRGVGFLPISDPLSGELVGVVTDRDLVTRMCAVDRRPSEMALSDVISTRPPYCLEDSDLQSAEDTMYRHQVSRLVVVDLHRRPIGVLGLASVLKALRRRRSQQDRPLAEAP